MAAKKLLVADDSLTIQKVIRLALSGAAGTAGDGYDIQAVSDGNDAIQQISLFRPDVVLIDVSLPGKSAFEVKRAINEHKDLEGVRFVLMSSAFEKVDEPQAQEVRFDGRLTKPFDPAHLREVLIQVLSRIPDQSPDRSNAADRIVADEPTVFLNSGDLSMSPPPIPDAPPAAPPGPVLRPVPPPDDDLTPPMPSGLPPPPPSFGPDSDESDIRDLTESTIRMSGLAGMGAGPEAGSYPGEPPPPPQAPPSLLPDPGMQPSGPPMDDFQWSVQEHSLKPPPGILDSGNTSFSMHPAQRGDPGKAEALGGPTGRRPPLSPDDLAPPPSTIPIQRLSAAEPASPAASVQMISASDMDEIVRSEVQKALQKITERILPEIAEKIIKQEIHRLLTE